MLLCIFLFFMWLLLNARVTVEVCLLGAVIAVVVCLLCRRMTGYRTDPSRFTPQRLLFHIRYTPVLVWEILKAGVDVLRIILSGSRDYQPAIARLHIPLKDPRSRVMLANSITLTAGTVTVAEKKGEYLVLCLDKSAAESIPDWRLTRMLKELEKEEKN